MPDSVLQIHLILFIVVGSSHFLCILADFWNGDTEYTWWSKFWRNDDLTVVFEFFFFFQTESGLYSEWPVNLWWCICWCK